MIDLNGKTLSIDKSNTGIYRAMEVYADCTVYNGTIEGGFAVWGGDHVVLQNVKFYGRGNQLNNYANTTLAGSNKTTVAGSNKTTVIDVTDCSFTAADFGVAFAVYASAKEVNFYGTNTITNNNSVGYSAGFYGNSNVYGTIKTNKPINTSNYSNACNLYGGSVVSTSNNAVGSSATTFSGGSTDTDDYALFSDSDCTTLLSAYSNQTAVYSAVVTPYNLAEDVTVAVDDQVYTGEALEPTVTVTAIPTGRVLSSETDYSVSYINNTNVGTATVTISAKEGGKCVGETTATFAISSLLDINGMDGSHDITIEVFNEDGEPVTLTDGKAPIQKGYSVVSNAKLTFTGAKVTEYEPDEEGNETGKYLYEVAKKPTANVVTVSHPHYLLTKTDNQLWMKCNWLIGAEFEAIAKMDVNATYEYGDQITIETQQLTDKYGEVTFGESPLYRNKSATTWDGNVRKDVGEYEARVGATWGETTFQLDKEFAIVQKDLGQLTAYVDLDGADSEYDETIETALPTITYNGKEYTPTVRLVQNNFWNGSTVEAQHNLTVGTDYTVTVVPGKNVGTYTITFTAVENGNYKNTKTVNWSIDKADMELTLPDNISFVYNGANTVDETQFVVDGIPDGSADPVFTYWQDGVEIDKPTAVGDYTVKATVTNPNYNDGEVTTNFSITARDVLLTPTAEQSITYGENIPATITYAVEASNDDRGVVTGETITGNLVTVDGTDILNAGTYDYVLTAEVEAYTNYNIELDPESQFTVNKKALTKEMFTVTAPDNDNRTFVYNKTEQAVDVTASDNITLADPYELPAEPLTINLIKDTDWQITDNSNKATDANTYTVIVSATDDGNYTGTVELDNDDQKWTIEPKSLTSEDITVTVTNDGTSYTGNEIIADIVVKDGEDTIVLDTDYTLAGQLSGTNAGDYTFTATGIGNYKDTKDKTWTIAQAELPEEALSIEGAESVVYDGKSVDGEYTVVGAPEDSGYTYTFKWSTDGGDTWTDTAPTNVGSYSVKALATNSTNYADTETPAFDFEITKRQVEIYPTEFQQWPYGTPEADIVLAYDVELAEHHSVTGLVEGDSKDLFANALALRDYTGNVGYYDIVLKNDLEYQNYTLTYDYPVQIEITRKPLTAEMFTITDSGNFVYDAKKKTVAIESAKDGDKDLVAGTDYTATGTFSAYTPGTYQFYIEGTGNYIGKVTESWSVASNTSVSATTVAENYVYNGETPVVSVVANEGTTLPKKSEISYKYYQKNGDEWTELTSAPVNAGDYKVQGVVTARGYEIEVAPAEFTIEQKEIAITLNAEDLNGIYDNAPYTIGYTYDESLILDADKTENFITGDVVILGDTANVNYDQDGNIIGNDLDLSGITVSNANYKLVLPADGQKFFLSPREIEDDDIQITNATVALTDIGTSEVEFKVVVNGKELVKDTDYEIAGTFATDTEGEYTVQVAGIGNYTGIALCDWSVAEDAEARATAVAAINDAVTVTISEPVAKIQAGKTRVCVDVTGSVSDNKYTITRTGLVYFNFNEQNNEPTEEQLTLGNVDGTIFLDAGMNNSSTYEYGMPDSGKGIYARGYVVVNDGKYETVKYTDVLNTMYSDIVEYTINVVGGKLVSPEETDSLTITGKELKEIGESVTVVAEVPEGKKFSHWMANGIEVSTSARYSFIVIKNVTVEAVFVDADTDVDIKAVLNLDVEQTNYNGKNALHYIFAHSVPNDYTVKQAGILYATNKLLGYTDDATVNLTTTDFDVETALKENTTGKVKNYVADYVAQDGMTELTYAGVNSNLDAYVYAYGYVVVEKDGTENTVYSDLIATSFNALS